MSDWIETTERLIQKEEYLNKFMNSDEFMEAFQNWVSKQFPEEYQND